MAPTVASPRSLPVRKKRRTLPSIASDPMITAAEAADLMRSPSHRVCRRLASNPGCPPEHFVTLAMTHPARVLRNPGFQMLCEFQPGFIESLGPDSLERLVGLPSATERFLFLCANLLPRRTCWRNVYDHIAAHRHSSPQLVERVPLAEYRRTARYSRAFAPDTTAESGGGHWRQPDLSVDLRDTWGFPLAIVTQECELLVRAMARRRLFSGSCRTTMHAIAAYGYCTSRTVLENHPSITPMCAEILLSRCVRSADHETHDGSQPPVPPVPEALKERHELYALWQLRRWYPKAPCEMPDMFAQEWDAIETAILAMQPNPVFELPRFLLLSGARCPAVLVADAARRGHWPMRLAAALNPNLHPSIRAHLASADPNIHVREAARRIPPSPPKSLTPIPAPLMIERCMPAGQRRRLARLRRLLLRNASSTRAMAVVQELASDTVLRRLLLNGIYFQDQHVRVHSHSSIHRIAHGALARQLACWISPWL